MLQEKEIARLLNGTVQVASGGTAFGGGDVHTNCFFIEAKTTTAEKQSFSIKKDWLDKMRIQMQEQRKRYSALAFRFDPLGQDYFVIDANLMRQLVEVIENVESMCD